MHQLTCNFGTFDLSTGQAGSRLKAWDAADLALLRLEFPASNIAVVGARWGALVVPLWPRIGTVVIDSAAGRAAIERNRSHQGNVPPDHLPRFLSDLVPWHTGHDAVLMRVPQSVDLFDWQLARACHMAQPGAPIAMAAMASTWSGGHTDVIHRLLGSQVSIRGEGKARVAHGVVPHQPPAPDEADLPWVSTQGPDGEQLFSLPGVFSHSRVDPGARALLSALPKRMSHVVDLGCGNGILGLAAKRRGAQTVTFTDDSARAIAAAEETWRAAGLTAADARFVHCDAGADVPEGEADVVLCNPPFHQGRAQTLHIVDAMLLRSRKLLRRGGRLLMVGNRHLRHERRAAGVLAGVRVVADDGRFSVIVARR
ncbi:MAG: methyltransferase [Myxococcales bacterium]|nr:methyltransferase [Myxococcales bacterium]